MVDRMSETTMQCCECKIEIEFQVRLSDFRDMVGGLLNLQANR